MQPAAARTLRLATGVVLAMAAAQVIAWPFAYLAPVLIVSLLAAGTPPLPLGAGLRLLLLIGLAVLLGQIASEFLLNYPVLFLGLLGLALLLVFYAAAGGLPPFIVLVALIGLLVIPMLNHLHPAVAEEVSAGLFKSALAAVLLTWVAHALVPGGFREAGPKSAAPPPREVRMRYALGRTAIVLPVVILLFTFNLTGKILTLIMICTLVMQPDAASGRKGGVGLLAANVVGGLAAMFCYSVLIAAPMLPMLLLLCSLAALLVGQWANSDHRLGALAPSVLSTMLLLVGSSIDAASIVTGTEADLKFYNRVFQIFLAALYTSWALALLDARTERRVAATPEDPSLVG